MWRKYICTQLYCISRSAYLLWFFLFVFQVVLVTKYWTKFNVAAVCVSFVLFFICTRITHSTRLFQRSPRDYVFIGTLLLISLSNEWCCSWLWLFQHLLRQELLELIHMETNNINTVDKNIQPNTQDEMSIWIPIHFFPVDQLMCHNSCKQVWPLCVCFSLGASDKAFINPVVWLTALLTAWTAVLPSLTAYALNVILTVRDKQKVRHLHDTHTDYRDSKKERWNVNLQREECKTKY